MSHDIQSKEVEKNQITRFAELLGFQEDMLFFPDDDPPDALIKAPSETIALEHTRVISEDERRLETIRQKCILATKKGWFLDSLPAISVNVIFNGQGPLSYSQIPEFSQKIQSKLTQFIGPLHIFKSRFSDAEITLHFSLCLSGMGVHWSCINNHVGWVKKISDKHLQKAIVKKSKAITRYSYPYDKAWLLVFVESEYASAMFSLDTQHFHDSSFDRIFLSDGFNYREIMRK